MATRQLSPASTSDQMGGLGEYVHQRSTVILFGLGVLAVVLHATYRFPLHLPGHHGLEWMAILMIARQSATYRWAAGVVAVGAAMTALVPAIGFHNPLTPLFYLVPALALDLIWMATPTGWHRSVPLLALMAALAFATKPLVQLAGMFAGVVRDHAAQPLLYVVVLHMLFALVGAAAASALWRSWLRRH